MHKGWFSLVNQGVVSATNFLTGVLIGRFCTKEEFGLFVLGFSIVLLVLGFADFACFQHRTWSTVPVSKELHFVSIAVVR